MLFFTLGMKYWAGIDFTMAADAKKQSRRAWKSFALDQDDTWLIHISNVAQASIVAI